MNAIHHQEFCVRWNSHLGSIGAAFPQLLAGQRFVDVTLACEGHTVHCHRLVLAACSSYFESILAENPCKHPVIILPSEIKLWEIQALVDFMYKGEVNVTQAGLPQLLRCAEQLRIRGLYGSDAALNLNQLKALSSKAAAATSAHGGLGGGGGAGGGSGGGGGSSAGNGGGSVGGVGSISSSVGLPNDGMETDDTATNSTTTTTTTTAASALQQATIANEIMIKKEEQTNGDLGSSTLHHHHQHLHHQQQQQQHHHQQQQHLQQNQLLHHHKQELQGILNPRSNSNVGTEDESADDSTSNAYDQYEDFAAANASTASKQQQQQQLQQLQQQHQQQQQQQLINMDSTIEDDHNYVAAHDEDDSFGGGLADTEHETSANSSQLQSSMNYQDASASFKRVRRSEASLAQAAKCVSKGQTFQTVSNMFNIPVSTIRFYMARKGILPKRKRGRGASTANSGSGTAGAAALSNAVMSQALAQMKNSGSPVLEPTPYHLVGYKMNEQQGAANMI